MEVNESVLWLQPLKIIFEIPRILTQSIKPFFFIFQESCHCGKILENKQVPRIVGGQEAEVNKIPWQVGLVKTHDVDFIFCGGTIIGPSTVITAAHCVYGPIPHVNSIKVLIAEHDVKSIRETPRQ